VTVKRLGGGRLLATEAKARGRDIVCLANNDEVAGTVLGMDEATVLMKTDYDQDPVDIERRYISSVTFYRQAPTLPDEDDVRVTLINGDVVTGRLVGLDAQSVVVETAVLGQLTLARTLVREFGTGAVEGPEGEAVGAAPDEVEDGRVVIKDANGEIRVVRRAVVNGGFGGDVIVEEKQPPVEQQPVEQQDVDEDEDGLIY
jgi:small nuclear ribonucleoprotein (snRNP)-like protein